ncbi:hypothetical protein ACJX0J_023459 [Zea mays]
MEFVKQLLGIFRIFRLENISTCLATKAAAACKTKYHGLLIAWQKTEYIRAKTNTLVFRVQIISPSEEEDRDTFFTFSVDMFHVKLISLSEAYIKINLEVHIFTLKLEKIIGK